VLVIRLVLGPLETNVYLLRDPGSGAGAVVDPAGEAGRIVERCREERLTPEYIVNTHAHVDHVGANAGLKEAFPAAVLCMGEEEAGTLADPVANLSAAFGLAAGGPEPDLWLREGDELRFGTVVMEVLETPGHTPGGISLLARGGGIPQLFCGDVLFRRGVGRTDLPGGDWAAVVDSIRRKLFTLPDGTVVWPGHGERTTIGEEKRENPFVAAL